VDEEVNDLLFNVCGFLCVCIIYTIFVFVGLVILLENHIVMTFLVRECYGSPKKQEFKKNL
jgi:hypothetical protein